MGTSSHSSLSLELAAYRIAPPGSRIILAEDDDALRDLFAVALRREGFAVVPAKDGSEVLKVLSAVSARLIPAPDLILLDVRMPSVSGLDVLRAVRLAEWTCPVVLVTGSPDARTRDVALAYGAFTMLEKPVRSDSLVAAVRQAICDAVREQAKEAERSSERPSVRRLARAM